MVGRVAEAMACQELVVEEAAKENCQELSSDEDLLGKERRK
jgi:hypothetical protein